MSRIIAEIYEIQEEIGSGGGGVVYLGRHIRLGKQIVLKADKRTLRTDPELLRKEVDVLKDLSHTYIPQVYDFVQEDGVVYTVMDYIEGESLDRILKRGELPAQAQAITWACELLEALCYLHSRPPHGILHGDIKPANIMLRPDGHICLIDYNIALALGEDGAVRAGFSRGYASPEHYGIEFGPRDEIIHTVTMGNGDAEITETAAMPKQDELTETMADETETRTMSDGVWKGAAGMKSEPGRTGGSSFGSVSSGTGRRRDVMLDVRSDIYSLGATLYHLLSGRRPAPDSWETAVEELECCSPAVAGIIKKAMAPNPKNRYQSAQEMLDAFRRLHKSDFRVRRRKRRIAVAASLLSMIFLAGGAMTFTGMKQIERRQEALTLAEYSANELAAGKISSAIDLALRAIPDGESIFDPPVTAQAKKALTDALGVYDLKDDFVAFDSIELPSAPFTVAVSPDGRTMAAVYQRETALYDMESRTRLAALPTQESALSDVLFVDDSTILYAGAEGVTAYDFRSETVLWTGEPGTTLAVSGDKTVAAAVNGRDEKAILYRMADGEKFAECSFEGQHMETAVNDIFANPANRIFCLNEDGRFLAASLSGGALWIFDVEDPEGTMVIFDESAYGHFEGGFCGSYFAFGANKSDESLFGLIDTEEAAYVASLDSGDHFHVQTDEKAVYLSNQNLLVRFDGETLEEQELAYTNETSITGFSIGTSYVMVVADDQSVSFYDPGAQLLATKKAGENNDFIAQNGEFAVIAGRNGPTVRLLKMESHAEAEISAYDARCIHEEARISGDKKTVMLFRYQDFHVFGMDGALITKVELPDQESIYDQQFRRSEEGSWLEVIWYDGTVRCYSAADGALLSEEKKEPPSRDLYEEFFTDHYRIASSLHGAPVVYDIKTGKQIKELEQDAYLTYVTQLGTDIITEYMSADGERYGLLLNEKLETEAYLPGLCDISDGELIFDFGDGSLRKSRVYSLEELIEMGKGEL